MNNLQKVLNIWFNLDKAYVDFKNAYPELIKSNLDFIKFLINYDDTNHTQDISYLKTKLAEDVSLYTDKELNDYSRILNILDGVDSILKEDSNVNIANLNTFIQDAESYSTRVKQTVKTLPDNYFDNLIVVKPKDKINGKLELFNKIYDRYGTIGNTYTIENGEIVSLISRKSDDHIIFTTKSQIDELFDEYRETKNQFIYSALVAMNELTKVQKLVTNTLILSNKYVDAITELHDNSEYTVKNNELKINIGSHSKTVKVTRRNLYRKDDILFTFVNIKFKFGTVPVICIL